MSELRRTRDCVRCHIQLRYEYFHLINFEKKNCLEMLLSNTVNVTYTKKKSVRYLFIDNLRIVAANFYLNYYK